MNLDDDDDITHFALRSALGRVLDSEGVVAVVTDEDGWRRWTFVDGLEVDERAHQQHLEPQPLGDRLHTLGAALAATIRATDPNDEDAAFSVRLALADVLTAARTTVGEEWDAVVLHEFGVLLREAGIERTVATVEDGRLVLHLSG